MPPRNTARGIIVHNNAVLLMERWRQDDAGHELHYFSIPGGGIEPGETPAAAATRELYEETSLAIKPIRLIATQVLPGGGQHNYFLCTYVSGEPALHCDAPETQRQCHSNRSLPRWVSAQEFVTCPLHTMYQPIRPVIQAVLDGAPPSAPVAVK